MRLALVNEACGLAEYINCFAEKVEGVQLLRRAYHKVVWLVSGETVPSRPVTRRPGQRAAYQENSLSRCNDLPRRITTQRIGFADHA